MIDSELNLNNTICVSQRVVPHELFIPRELYYDIALLQLTKSVKFRDYIWPACLHNEYLIVDENEALMLSGWKGNNGRRIDKIMKGKIERISQNKCREIYGENVQVSNGITNNLFCARINSCDSKLGINLSKL